MNMELTKEQKEYLKKWDNLSKEDLMNEEIKWSDFLWFGRHLSIKDSIIEDYLNSNDEEHIEIAKKALFEEEKIMNQYANDTDFIRCIVYPESDNGDKEWEEITNNVGSLRYLTTGYWFTDS